MAMIWPSIQRDVAIYVKDGLDEPRFISHVTVSVYDTEKPAKHEARALIEEIVRIYKETPEIFENRNLNSWIMKVINNLMDDADDFVVKECSEYWLPLPIELEPDLDIEI